MKRLSKILSKCRKNEGGAMLIELLVAVTITGIIMAGIATAVIQVITVKALSQNMLTATKQVENAFHYLIRDVQQCSNATIELVEQEEPKEPKEVLVLEWTWIGEDAPYHQVVYEIDEDTGKLYRKETTSEWWSGPAIKEEQTLIAQYIDTAEVDWEVILRNDLPTVKMTIAATVGGFKTQEDTRFIPVTPRLSSKPEVD